MDLALNDQQLLICHKTKPNEGLNLKRQLFTILSLHKYLGFKSTLRPFWKFARSFIRRIFILTLQFLLFISSLIWLLFGFRLLLLICHTYGKRKQFAFGNIPNCGSSCNSKGLWWPSLQIKSQKSLYIAGTIHAKLSAIIIITIIVIIIILFWEFFTPALADALSLELEWQQVFSSLQDSSQYSGRSQ